MSRFFHRFAYRLCWPACVAAAFSLQGCGGGGQGAGSEGLGGDDPQAVYFDAPYTASMRLRGQCGDLRQKQFIRSYLDEVYLWPDQVQRRDAKAYGDAPSYYDALLAPLEVDRFSSSMSTAAALAQQNTQSFDPGIHWVNTGSSAAPIWRVSRVDPGSPADIQGIRRGDTLVGTVSTNLDSVTGPYYYDFTYRRNGRLLLVSLVPTMVVEDPVGDHALIVSGTRRVGYLAFDAHYGDAQDQLIKQIHKARLDQVHELVVDLRYNTGGFIYIAGTLASMLAPQPTVHNHPEFVRLLPHPRSVLAQDSNVLRLSPSVQFTAEDATYPAGTPLPSLNLNRVYVLTSEATCSASEMLINGLRGIGVPVYVIGNTTCGKPYAMEPTENCGVAYFPVAFRGVNAQGWGHYERGLYPTCQVDDDLDHDRGDAGEAMLKTALVHMETGTCPANLQASSQRTARTQMSSTPSGALHMPPRRERAVPTLLLPR